MKVENYTLDVVSLDSRSEKKRLKKYAMDGVNFVGVYENEPFEIAFRNNTHKKVGVKVSLDGTDIISGNLANTSTNETMWIVRPYSNLELKAWPETNNGGARFVFTTEENGVAAHTHGVLASKGIIAVAVFEDVYEAPRRNAMPFGSFNNSSEPYYHTSVLRSKGTPIAAKPSYSSDSFVTIKTNDSRSETKSSARMDLDARPWSMAVGAGEQVEQVIGTTVGLINPQLKEIIKVNYERWSSLKSKIYSYGKELASNGFPGDSEILRLNLGKTPRIKSSAKKSSGKSHRKSKRRIELERFA